MPKVTIWIRNEDYDKWQAIADKPAWLHEHLGIDILKNRINGQEIFHVNRKPTGHYEASNPKLTRTKYPSISTNTNSTGVLSEAFLNEQYNKAAKAGDPEMSDPTYTDAEDAA